MKTFGIRVGARVASLTWPQFPRAIPRWVFPPLSPKSLGRLLFRFLGPRDGRLPRAYLETS